MFQNPQTTRIAEFLNTIGIMVVAAKLEDGYFLPGIRIESGRLAVDENKLEYPGDLLHEAGHLAVAPGEVRSNLSGEVVIPDADMSVVEQQATAWAYAAVTYLGMDPSVLFHEGGYKGKSQGLIFTYGSGVYLGANRLQEINMTVVGEMARTLGIPPYPHMLKWIRD